METEMEMEMEMEMDRRVVRAYAPFGCGEVRMAINKIELTPVEGNNLILETGFGDCESEGVPWMQGPM